MAEKARRQPAEHLLPETVAQDGDIVTPGAIGGGVEVVPDERRRAERPKVAGADALAAEPLRGGVTSQRGLPGPYHGERTERAASGEELGVRAEGDIHPVATIRAVGDHDDLARLGIWERLEQNGIDRSEDRGGRADADRQREHRREREARRGAEPAHCVARVGDGGLDPEFPAVAVHLFADGRRITRSDAGSAPGSVRRESIGLVVSGGHREVVPHLVRDILAGGGRVAERMKPVPELAPERHGGSAFGVEEAGDGGGAP